MPYCDGGELFDAVALQRRFTEAQVMAHCNAAVHTLLACAAPSSFSQVYVQQCNIPITNSVHMCRSTYVYVHRDCVPLCTAKVLASEAMCGTQSY
jgi:hypothetical protein